MDSNQKHHGSHLFTLRLWAEEGQEGHGEWRVQLQNVASGETRYFRDWPTLIHLLVAMLPEERPEENTVYLDQGSGTRDQGSGTKIQKPKTKTKAL